MIPRATPPPLCQFLPHERPYWSRKHRRWQVKLAGQTYWFDPLAAERPVRFIETFCAHDQGAKAGDAFLLEPWEKDVARCLFGWKRSKDNLRRFRELFLFVPSGNGKSMFFSGLLLFVLFAGGEPGAEMYNIAADVEQARPIFQSAVYSVQSCPALARRSEIFGLNPNAQRRAIVHKNGSFYQVLTSTAERKHGKRTYVVAIDEVHVLPGDGRNLRHTLVTSTKKRREPLVLEASTAGFQQDHICFELFEQGKAVRDGLRIAPEFLPVLYYAEQDADWTAPETWRKANPNLNVSITEEDLATECREAQEIPSRQNWFKRLRLNIWTEQESLWIPVEKWDAADPERFSPERLTTFQQSLAGQECFAGLDLSTNVDLTGLARVFAPTEARNHFAALFTFWVPKDNVQTLVTRYHLPRQLLEWTADCHCHRGGKPAECPALIHTTPGNVIDYDFIRAHVNALNDLTPIRELAVDKYGATHIITQLTSDFGEDRVLAVPQTVAFFTPPMREFERLVLSKLIRHAGHPVARWHLQSMTVKLDPSGGIRPVKIDRQKSSKRIDGIVAALNALSRSVLHVKQPEPSIFIV